MQKCNFICTAHRKFDTGDPNDVNFFLGEFEAVTAYQVYVGAQSVVSGYHEYVNFMIPLGAEAVMLPLAVLAAALLTI